MAETWLLKETLSGAEMYDSSIKFTADNRPFQSLHWSQSTLTSMTDDDNLDTIYFYRNGAFTDPALRTIIFATSPTGDLLTWLQDNGIKIVTIETGTYVFKDIPDTVSVQFDKGIDINFKVKGSTYSWNKIYVDAKSRYGVRYFTSENPGWNVGYVDIHVTAQSNYVWGYYDESVEDMDGDADADTKTITIETAQNVPENFVTWFNANTTKQVPRKSYDLSTSAKWATLTEGNHNVQIVAKASGYRDSEKSAAVTVNKTIISAGTYKFNDTISAPASGSATAFIKFKVNNTSYNSIGVTSLVSVMYTETLGEGITVYNNTDKWAAVDTANQIITITADKEVPYKFYEWFTANASAYTPTYNDCITFTGESSDFTLSVGTDGAKEWNGTVWYSTDHSTWTTWDGTAISSVDKKLYLRGKNNTKFYTSKGACLSLSAKAGCSGNIQTLLDYETPPTSILANNCYANMFGYCTGLTTAPTLPATTLKTECYYAMFYGCTNLVVPPELPAETLVTGCYGFMFSNCTSLTVAPLLSDTTLVTNCYTCMFSNCTSLKVNNTSGAKIFTCPSNLPTGAVVNMFVNTGGSFTDTPTAGNTYYWYE